MYDAGIDGRASEPYDDEPRKRKLRRGHGDDEQYDAQSQHARAYDDHPSVAYLRRDETAKESPRRDADVKEGCKLSRLRLRDVLDFDEIGACPLHGGRFRRAIGEESDEDEGHTLDLQRAEDTYVLLLDRVRLFAVDLPHGQRHKQQRRDPELDVAHDAAAVIPCGGSQRIAHDEGADDRAHSPEAMQPTHMACGIMKGDVIVESGIDGSRAQPVRDGKQDEHPKAVGEGKAEERSRGQKYADHRHHSCPELARQPVRHQTGNYRPARNDHGNDAHIGHGDAELAVHSRPARSEQRVRQPETDEGKIDERKQQRIHFPLPRAPCARKREKL